MLDWIGITVLYLLTGIFFTGSFVKVSGYSLDIIRKHPFYRSFCIYLWPFAFFDIVIDAVFQVVCMVIFRMK